MPSNGKCRLRDRGMARILIIDDNAALRATLRQMLEHAGHQVTEAANGAEGIRFFEQDAPDLVITDIFMPDKEGIETIIALHRANAELPIIAISGGGRVDAMDYLTAAKKLGARHALSKPFHRDRLLEAVRECLSGNEARKNHYG